MDWFVDWLLAASPADSAWGGSLGLVWRTSVVHSLLLHGVELNARVLNDDVLRCLICRPILVFGSVLMQSWQLASVCWGCTEPMG